MRTPSVVALILAMLACALPGHASRYPLYSFPLGARSLALGEAFVGLADDESALLYNAAGLAFADGLSFVSSSRMRSGVVKDGDIMAIYECLGLAVSYTTFGDIPQIDHLGSIIGTFSYSHVMLVGAIGLSGHQLSPLFRIALPDWLGIGLAIKLVRTNTLDPGDGIGLALDLPILLRLDKPILGRLPITRFSLGLSIRDALGLPMMFESEHQEKWPSTAAIGCSVLFVTPLLISAELTSAKTIHLGMEWTPVPQMVLRSGVKYKGVWVYSIGVGFHMGMMTLDLTTTSHPHLPNEIRASFTISL